MTSTLNSGVCRVTVVTPDRRVDLALPVSTTVAALLPVLLRHATVGDPAEHRPADAAWVLQRLGEPPFDLAGTPESLDWLEGEEIFLRPAAGPLPELDFDDVADGIATTVNRRADRWRPEYRRPLFLALSTVVLVVVAAVGVDLGPLLSTVAACAVSVGLMLASVLVARTLTDGTLSLLLGTAACGYASITAMNLLDGVDDAFVLNHNAIAAGAAVAAGAALVLLGCRRLGAQALPYPPLLAVAAGAAATLFVWWLRVLVGLPAPAAGAVASAALFAVIVGAPKLVLRAARLRGPQLPKNGEELQYDNQPQPAAELSAAAGRADTYLSVGVVSVALVVPVLFRLVLTAPGWAGPGLVAALSGALLLRARTFLGVWQRTALTAAGSAGLVILIVRFSAVVSPGSRLILLAGLLVVLAMLVAAALRPWPRRLLPIWEFSATVLDVVTGLAVLPLALQLLGTYAWARGLFG